MTEIIDQSSTNTDCPPIETAPPLVPIKPIAYRQKSFWFGATVLLQLALMCSVAMAPAVTLLEGRVITLETVPVDPCDMFRGDYVRLGYDFNASKISPPPVDGQTVYTALYQDREYWRPRLSSTQKPALKPGEVCLKGRYDQSRWRVTYGIEQVFVPEKTGRAAEQAKHLQVEVAVDQDGNAAIKRVHNGESEIYDADRVIFGAAHQAPEEQQAPATRSLGRQY